MKRILAGAIVLALGVGAHGFAQSLDELNIQIHGYATQGFLYTTNNNILTTHSSDGSPAWTEAVLNVGAQPIPKLRIGVYSQHSVDQLELDKTPVEYLRSKFPDLKYEMARKYLGTIGLPGHIHEHPIRTLSGGQKSRVVFVELQLTKCHILLFDVKRLPPFSTSYLSFFLLHNRQHQFLSLFLSFYFLFFLFFFFVLSLLLGTHESLGSGDYRRPDRSVEGV